MTRVHCDQTPNAFDKLLYKIYIVAQGLGYIRAKNRGKFQRLHPRANGGAEYRWGMKNRDFRPLSRYISETVQDTDIVTMERS